MKSINELLISVLLLSNFIYCTKHAEKIIGPQQGAISGHVKLYDWLGNETISAAGVTVTIISTDLTTKTDNSGFWRITGIPNGIYTVLFTKEGYAEAKNIDGFVFSNGEYYARTEMLCGIPQFDVKLHGAFSPREMCATVTFSINPVDINTGWGYIQFFIGFDENVSNDPRTYIAEWRQVYQVQHLDSAITAELCLKRDSKLFPGATVYIAAYPSPRMPGICSGCVDPGTGKYHYNALGDKSNIVKVMLN